MVKTKTTIIGSLLFIIATALVIIISQGSDIKYEIGKNDTKLYINESSNWNLIGTESWNVYSVLMGSKLKPSVSISTDINKVTNVTKVIRKITYSGYAQIFDTYVFDGKEQNVEAIPKERYLDFKITKPIVYEYVVSGFEPTSSRAANLVEQYKRLKVILDPGYDSAFIDNGILKAKYEITSNSTLFIKMIDPLWNVTGTITYNLPSLDPSPAYASSVLNCSIYVNFQNISNVTYTNETNFTVDIEYFKNNAQQYTYSKMVKSNTSTFIASGNVVNGTSVLDRGDTWHCRVRYFTAESNATFNQSVSPLYISNYVTINGTNPTLSLISPTDGSSVYISPSSGISLVVNGSDIDNDTINYVMYGAYSDVSTTAPNTSLYSLITMDTPGYYCYQGRADRSTSCGGLSNGTYAHDGTFMSFYPETLAHDEDFSTYALSTGDASLYINYSVNSSLIWVNQSLLKFTVGTVTQYIPTINCTYSNTSVNIRSWRNSSGNTRIYCRNSTDWSLLYASVGTSTIVLNEIGMFWYVNGTYTSNYNLADTSGNGKNFTSSNTDTLLMSAPGAVNKSLLFNGANDSVYLNDTRMNITKLMLNETNPEGMFISSDGLRLYTIGTTLDTIYKYNMTQPWNISNATPSGESLNLSLKDATSVSVFFNGSGTRMYVLGITNDIVMQYNLSIAWNLTSAVYANNVSVAAVETSGSGIWFSPNGSIMYLTGYNSDLTTQWRLSTPWLVSSATYAGMNISNPETTITDMYLDSTGTILHLVGTTNDRVYQYVLSTPFDITTATQTALLSVGILTAQPNSLFFNGSGKTMYVYESDNDSIRQFNLANAYDFSDPLWSNGFCWSAWILPDSLGETAGRVIDKTDTTGTVGGVGIAIQTNGQTAVFYNGETTLLSTVGSTPLNALKHLVVTMNSSGYTKIYVNGLLNNQSQSAYNMSKFTSIYPLTIGNNAGGTVRSWAGYIDQVRIYRTTCSDAQANAIYHESGLSLPCNGKTYSLLSNGTSNIFNWASLPFNTAEACWYASASSINVSETSVTSSTYKFYTSFMNWTVQYSPGVSAIEIKPNASSGTFYPTNQSDLYGVFNITNNEASTLTLSVNLSTGLPKYINVTFYTNLTNVSIVKNTYPEPAKVYNRFSDGKTTYRSSFISGSYFICGQPSASSYNVSCPYNSEAP